MQNCVFMFGCELFWKAQLLLGMFLLRQFIYLSRVWLDSNILLGFCWWWYSLLFLLVVFSRRVDSKNRRWRNPKLPKVHPWGSSQGKTSLIVAWWPTMAFPIWSSLPPSSTLLSPPQQTFILTPNIPFAILVWLCIKLC